MKAIRNSVHLLGNLGKDVEMLTFGSNMKKATVSLATTLSLGVKPQRSWQASSLKEIP